jgi:hypothetical protein
MQVDTVAVSDPDGHSSGVYHVDVKNGSVFHEENSDCGFGVGQLTGHGE